MPTEKLTQTLAIRVSDADMQRLEAVADKFPIVTARALARIAMRIGLEAIESDPTKLLETPIPHRGGARKRKAKAKTKTTGQRRKR